MKSMRLRNQWTRSSDGWVAGVCQGLGERLELNPAMVRLVWFLSVLFFGVGLLLYLVCAFVMPVEGNEDSALQPKLLGVCYRLSEKLDIDVVPLRIFTVFAFLGSAGVVLLAYLLLHILLPRESRFQE